MKRYGHITMVLTSTALANRGLTYIIKVESCSPQLILFIYHLTTIHQQPLHSHTPKCNGDFWERIPDSQIHGPKEWIVLLLLGIVWPHVVCKAKVVATMQPERIKWLVRSPSLSWHFYATELANTCIFQPSGFFYYLINIFFIFKAKWVKIFYLRGFKYPTNLLSDAPYSIPILSPFTDSTLPEERES